MKALLKYHASSYIISAKFVMPMLVYFLFLVAFYCNAPKMVVSSFAVSAAIVYIIMVWTGFTFGDSEEAIAEQILILKSKSIKTYYVSKVVFLFAFSGFMALVGIIIPMLFNIGYTLGGASLFVEGYNITVPAIAIGYVVHLVSGFLGGALGFFFHPRLFRNRKVTIIISLIFAIIGFLKGPIIEDFVYAKFIVWIFPPIYDLIVACDQTDVSNVFPIVDMIVPMAIMMVYAVIISIICVRTVRKIGF